MTRPRDPQAEAAPDPGPEVKPEIIQDLDVADGGADIIRGGCAGGVSYVCLPDSALKDTL